MISLRFALVVSMLLALAVVIPPNAVKSATPQIAESADKVVSLRNVTATVTEVSGEVVNNSSNAVRDVNVEILYSWRWNNEMHPGTDDPGGAVGHMIDTDITPGHSARYNYNPQSPVYARE